MRALVDSGATRSFAGVACLKLLSLANIPACRIPPRKILLAGGQVEFVDHTATFMATLRGREIETTAYLMPSLSEDFILGMDFLRDAKIIVDFYGQTWCYRDAPDKHFEFIPMEYVTSVILCCGLRSLEPPESQQLQELLDIELPSTTDKPGLTSLTAHNIDVGDNPPIR